MFVSERASTWRHPWLVGLGMGLQWMAIIILAVDRWATSDGGAEPVRIAALAGMLAGGALLVVGARKRTRSQGAEATARAEASTR